MPFYAFEDQAKTQEVWAENINNHNRRDEYFCPTHNCPGRFYVRAIDSDIRTNFAIKHSYPHSDFCRIGIINKIKETEYNEDLFVLNDFIDNLLNSSDESASTGGTGGHGTGDGTERPISTVRQLYAICIQMSINQTYNNVRISDLLADTRTGHIYMYFIRGFKLVECYCYRFDPVTWTYYARYYRDEAKTQKLDLVIKCKSLELFNKLYKNIFKKNIVVAGKWETQYGICKVQINNRKQIYTLTT